MLPGSPIAFLAIWAAMMVGMMLPSLILVLRRYRHRTTLLAGYFLVWAVYGAAAYVIWTALGRASQRSPALGRALPIALGIALALSGVIQFTGWKARHLACCRECAPAASRGAWSDGVRLGVHCCLCCLALMALLFALGMMRLWAMVAVGALIAAERLVARPLPVVRMIGVVVIAVGTFRAWRALS